MITRMSTLFLRTLREDPADAELPGHRLLVQRRLHPPGGAGHLQLAAARLPGAAQRREDRPRGDERDRRPGSSLPGAAAPRALRADRTVDRVRRQHLPAQGPRGNDYLLGPTHEEMFTLLVKDIVSSYKQPAVVAVPDPDQVPRRGPAAGGPAARPRVRHEGLLHLRRRRRRPGRRLRTAPVRRTSGSSTGSASSTSWSRRCPGRWAAPPARSSSPFRRTARTPSSATTPAPTPPTSRRSTCRRPLRWR